MAFEQLVAEAAIKKEKDSKKKGKDKKHGHADTSTAEEAAEASNLPKEKA
jgi:hypothetical protein